MVNKLQFLRSLNSGVAPVGLSVGEIAFNLADKKLFVGDGSGTITRLDGTTESVDLGSGYFESDLSVLTANAYTDQKIAELIDSAPELLNTLNELAAAIADDPNFVTTITSAVSTVQSNLNSEITRAQSAESSLQASLASEIARAQAAENAIAANLAAEVSRASAAESALEADLATEISRAQAAEGALQDAIDAEAAARAAADSAEQSARIAGDNALQSNVDNEAAARAAADSTLQSNLNAEISRAQAAEAGLNNRLADIESGIDLGTFGGGGGSHMSQA